MTLKAGEDFDYVILGIGIGALDPICTELRAASQKWADMLDCIKTVQTQAIQLWFKPDSAELGVPQTHSGHRRLRGTVFQPDRFHQSHRL